MGSVYRAVVAVNRRPESSRNSWAARLLAVDCPARTACRRRRRCRRSVIAPRLIGVCLANPSGVATGWTWHGRIIVRKKGKPRDGIGALLRAGQPTLKTGISAPHSIYRLYRRPFSLFLLPFLPFLLFWLSSALALFSCPLNAVLRWLHGSVDLWTHESSHEPATGRCRSEHGAGRKFVTGVTVMSRRSRQGAYGI
jgi:hypothetical protein